MSASVRVAPGARIARPSTGERKPHPASVSSCGRAIESRRGPPSQKGQWRHRVPMRRFAERIKTDRPTPVSLSSSHSPYSLSAASNTLTLTFTLHTHTRHARQSQPQQQRPAQVQGRRRASRAVRRLCLRLFRPIPHLTFLFAPAAVAASGSTFRAASTRPSGSSATPPPRAPRSSACPRSSSPVRSPRPRWL